MSFRLGLKEGAGAEPGAEPTTRHSYTTPRPKLRQLDKPACVRLVALHACARHGGAARAGCSGRARCVAACRERAVLNHAARRSYRGGAAGHTRRGDDAAAALAHDSRPRGACATRSLLARHPARTALARPRSSYPGDAGRERRTLDARSVWAASWVPRVSRNPPARVSLLSLSLQAVCNDGTPAGYYYVKGALAVPCEAPKRGRVRCTARAHALQSVRLQLTRAHFSLRRAGSDPTLWLVYLEGANSPDSPAAVALLGDVLCCGPAPRRLHLRASVASLSVLTFASRGRRLLVLGRDVVPGAVPDAEI